MSHATIRGDRYKIIETLQNGPRAVIRLVADMHEGDKQKIIKSSITAKPEDIKGIRHEDAVLSHLFHRGIIERHDYWEDCDGVHLVLEHIAGATLHDYLKERTKLMEREVRILAIKVVEALGAAHRQGFIHGDLKPGNIMLCVNCDKRFGSIHEDSIIKIIDWETASPTGKKAHRAWTRAYASPEAWSRKPLDQTHDYYALGIIMFEAATGRVPFKRDGLIIKEQVLMERPDAILEMSEGLNLIVSRLLAKDKGQRFAANGRELLAALSDSQSCKRETRSQRKTSFNEACCNDHRVFPDQVMGFCENALTACLIYLLLSLLFKALGWGSFQGEVTIGLLFGIFLTLTCEIWFDTSAWTLCNILFFCCLGVYSAISRHFMVAIMNIPDAFTVAIVSIAIGICNGLWNIKESEGQLL